MYTGFGKPVTKAMIANATNHSRSGPHRPLFPSIYRLEDTNEDFFGNPLQG